MAWGQLYDSSQPEAAPEEQSSPIYPQLSENNKKQPGMKGSGQFSHQTARDSVISTHLIARGSMETLSHLARETSDASHNGQWSD